MALISRGVKAVSVAFIPADGGQSVLPYPGNSTTLYPDPSDEPLTISVVYAAIRVLSETVASLPLQVYRNLPNGGKEKAREHPLYRVLHHRANPQMTSFIWRETSMAHLAAWGNCYSEIVPNALGEPTSLYPLRPDRMTVSVEAGKVVYDYQRPGEAKRRIPSERVFHIPGLSFDGVKGYSPVALMRNPLGIIRSAEAYGKRVLDNDSRPSTVLKYPGKLSKDARRNIRETMDGWRGAANAGKSAILEEGLDIASIGFPAADAQYLETRRFQIEEIARSFRMQPHMIGDLSHGTYSNIENQSLEFVKYTMLPWLERWEQQLTMQLVDPDDTGEYFAEFLVDALERADAVARATALQIQRQNGVLNGDEWRAIENRNPIEDGSGQEFWRPMNFSNGTMDQQVTAATTLVNAGYDPQAALLAVGLDPIRHSGLIPRKLLPPADGTEGGGQALLTVVKTAAEATAAGHSSNGSS